MPSDLKRFAVAGLVLALGVLSADPAAAQTVRDHRQQRQEEQPAPTVRDHRQEQEAEKAAPTVRDHRRQLQGRWGVSPRLRVVNVNSDVFCVFDPACGFTSHESSADIPVRGGSGRGRLRTRFYRGLPGSPGDGKYVYVYRADMVDTTGPTCLTSLRVNFGPGAMMQYDAAGPLDHMFVVASGGLGAIGIASAVQDAGVITFTFSTPVCAGSSTYFFGLAATMPPTRVMAQVTMTFGASGATVTVGPAIVPTH